MTGKRIIGHRGAKDLWPENGLTGFRNVLSLGVDGVEFDVHPTADGDLAVIHDATLDRTTDGTGPVAERTMAELRALRLKGGEEGVPSLDEVLDVLGPSGVELHIELKGDVNRAPYPGLAEKVAGTVRRRGLANRTVLTSFWPEVWSQMRAAFSGGRLLASLNDDWLTRLGGMDAVLAELEASRVDLLAVHKDLLSRDLDVFLRRVGAERLGAWVINEPEEIARWLDSPVALITTDRPDRLPAARRVHAPVTPGT